MNIAVFFFTSVGILTLMMTPHAITKLTVKLGTVAASALLFINAATPASAQITTTNYEFKDYGFDSGGSTGTNTTSYSLFGSSGNVDQGSLDFSSYRIGAGLIPVIQANVPPAPTLSNPGGTYDRLLVVLDTGGNPSDTLFAIAISSDNFVTTQYLQDDGTVGATLGTEDFQTYSDWGSGTGTTITGLTPNTTYKVKAKARQGNYTETGFGPESTGVATSVPSLTFGVDADTITFDNLNAGNSHTDSAKSTTLTTSTNAYNGYIVHARVTQPLTFGATTIANYASPNSAPTTWSGFGFGYTTNDAALTGGTANRFTNGGPNYAGFTTSSSGDPVADHAGPVTSAISNEQFTISYRISTDTTQAAGRYSTTVIYTVTPDY